MKQALLIILLFYSLATPFFSQAQNFVWAKHAGGNNNIDNYGAAIATDQYHNTVVTGTYSSGCNYGSSTLSGPGPHNIFLAKYDSSGNVIWLITMGGDSTDEAGSVALDSNGNIYIAGNMHSPYLFFGLYHHLTNTNINGWNSFIAKYDYGGHFIWAKSINSLTDNKVFSVTTDAAGNVVIGGYFTGQAYFSDTTIRGGKQNIFIAKYSSSGSLLWVRSGISDNVCFAKALACDPAGNIYATGKVSGAIAFGSTPLGNITDQYFDGAMLPLTFTAQLPDAAISFTGSYMHVSGGAGDNSNNITTNYVSNLEHFKVESNLLITSPGSGVGIGKFSGSPILAEFPLNDTVDNQIRIYNFGILSVGSNYHVAVGDSINISLERDYDSILATLINYTRHYSISAGYRFLIGLPLFSTVMPNFGPYGMYFSGGAQNVYNFKLSSTENKNALCVFTGNSITTGYYSGGKGHRFQDILYANNPWLYATNAGAGDKSVNVMLDSIEMIALQPKYAFVNIGVNDARAGFDLVLYQNRLHLLCQTYKNHGITPVLATLTPQDPGMVDPYNLAIKAVGLADTITVVDIWSALVDSTTGFMKSMYNSGDNVHPNPAGNVAMAAAIAAQAPFLIADIPAWNFSHKVTTLTPGNDKAFVARFLPDGQLDWITTDTNTVAQGSSPNKNFSCGNGIATDNSEGMYVGGSLLDARFIVSGVPVTIQDAFVSKYNRSGTLVWQKRWGSNTNDAVTGLAVNAAGAPYAIGNYSGDIVIGSKTLSGDLSNVFIARFDTSGNNLWVKNIEGHACFGNAIAIDKFDSSILTTGNFNNQAIFDSILLESSFPATFYNYDLFVARQEDGAGYLNINKTPSLITNTIYPNPTSDQLNIKLNKPGHYSISLFDVVGKCCAKFETAKELYTIDTKPLASGIYYIHISDGKNLSSYFKFAKID